MIVEFRVIYLREDGWWTGEDKDGKTGLVPSTLLKVCNLIFQLTQLRESKIYVMCTMRSNENFSMPIIPLKFNKKIYKPLSFFITYFLLKHIYQ